MNIKNLIELNLVSLALIIISIFAYSHADKYSETISNTEILIDNLKTKVGASLERKEINEQIILILNTENKAALSLLNSVEAFAQLILIIGVFNILATSCVFIRNRHKNV